MVERGHARTAGQARLHWPTPTLTSESSQVGPKRRIFKLLRDFFLFGLLDLSVAATSHEPASVKAVSPSSLAS